MAKKKRTFKSVLADIKKFPEKHRHSAKELNECATIDGKINFEIIAAHAHLMEDDDDPELDGPSNLNFYPF